MPAAFDHIKEVTGIEKIAFVGFSEGSTMMFYAMATNPEYWEKRVSIFIALGPVTKMTNSSSEAV
jgi:predicted esterase